MLPVLGAEAQDPYAHNIERLGGSLTVPITGSASLQSPAPNLFDRERLDEQVLGFSIFHRQVTPEEGVGPHFINSSCGGCHINNGKGKAELRRGRFRENTMVVKVSLDGQGPNGEPIHVPGEEEQIQDRSLEGRRTKMRLKWRVRKRGTLRDGTPYELVEPRARFKLDGYKRRELRVSLRMAPLLIGLGLTDSIPEAALLANADPLDLDGDGISGKPNWVPNLETGELEVGRFGHRAGQPNLRQQSAAASFFDMGVANSLFNSGDDSGELSDDQLEKLTAYQALASVPAARKQNRRPVVRGKYIFQRIGCDDCHTMTFRTGEGTYPELSNQTFHPFSDYLLHDMGRGLADNRPEFGASGREWKTAPLWGLGMAETLSSSPPRYLHDGRARDLNEAILWHGGEASRSRRKYERLLKPQRKALWKFLLSL